METDIYKAPEADLQPEGEAIGEEFYVVSKGKFLLLFFATCGVYEIYWFYRHWSLYARANGEKMLPVMRAIFSIFFAHSLFFKLQSRIEQKGIRHHWSPALMATIYVLMAIVSNISSFFSSDSGETSIVAFAWFASFPLTAWVLYSAQRAANIACGDEGGERNANFTPANYLWLVIGALIWILVGVGLYDQMAGFPL